MRSKNDKQLAKKRVLHIAGVLTVILLLPIGAYIYQKNSQPTEEITTLKGIVTEKSPPITDANQFMTIDEVKIQTSESGLKSKEDRKENFKVDTFSIKRGDTVEVHYLKTGDNEGTLRCKECFIKKDNTIFRPSVNGREL